MDIEEALKTILQEILKKVGLSTNKIELTKEENNSYLINISSDEAGQFIGHHGDNIFALQHLLKTIAGQRLQNQDFNILLDIDNYRARQEKNAINLAQRKIELARKYSSPQTMPPMSAYLRRKVHLHCMGAGMEDIETFSAGEGDQRHIIIKLKS